MTEKPPGQHIWPMFGVAGLVVAIGLWLALGHSSTHAAARSVAEPFLPPMPQVDPEPIDEPVTFERSARARALKLMLRQQRRSSAGVQQTSIELTVKESTPRGEGDELVWERTYHDARIALMSDGRPYGRQVAREVERLLETARSEIRAQDSGELESRLVSAEAAQLRGLLGVIEQMIEITQPRRMREAVLAEETWEWTVPVTARPPADVDADATGNSTVSARVLGRVNGDIAVAMTMQTEASVNVDVLTGDDDGVESVRSNRAGRGQALALWGSDGLAESDLQWEQLEGEVQTTVRARITVVPETE